MKNLAEINSKILQFKYELEDLGWKIYDGIGRSVIYKNPNSKESITFIPEFQQIEFQQIKNDGVKNIVRLNYFEILEVSELLSVLREYSNREIEKFRERN